MVTILEDHDETPLTFNKLSFEYYLKGKYFLTRDAAGTERALEYFERAIEADSGFALAHAGMAATYVNMAFYEFMKPKDALSRAKKAGLKAIELRQNEGYSHEQMAYAYMFLDWDWEKARREYETTVKLGHRSHFGQWYNALLFGNFDMAIEQAESYVKLDPLSVEEHWHLGVMNYLDRNYQEAIESFRETTELFPGYSDGYFWLGKCYLKMGDTENTLKNWDKGVAIAPNEASARSYKAFTHIIRGEEQEFEKLLHMMISSRDTIQPDYLPLTRVYTAMGDFDKAFEFIGYAMEDRALWVLSLKHSPDWDVLREDGRFEEIISIIDYPDQEIPN